MLASVYFLNSVFFLILLHLILYHAHDAELEIRNCKDFNIFMYARVCISTHEYTCVWPDTCVNEAEMRIASFDKTSYVIHE